MIAMVEVNACGSVKLTAILVDGAVDVLVPAPLASLMISDTLRFEFRRALLTVLRFDPPLPNTPGLPLLIACKEAASALPGVLLSNDGIPLPKLRRNIPVVTTL